MTDIRTMTTAISTTKATETTTMARTRTATDSNSSGESRGGSRGIRSIDSFDDMDLKESLLRGIMTYGFENPTPIQSKAICPIAAGHDMIVQAKAGEGKTATFAIGALQLLDESHNAPQVLMLAPVREVADQTTKVTRALGDYMDITAWTFIGGRPVVDDIAALRHGVQVACGTPGRLRHLIEQGHLDTRHIKVVIFDEADELLSQGFVETVQEIFKTLPSTVQAVLVSATMPADLVTFSDKILREPVRVLIKPSEVKVGNIRQHFIDCRRDEEKLEVIQDLYKVMSVSVCIIFVNRKDSAMWLQRELDKRDYSAAIMHSDLEQAERTEVMSGLRNGRYKVLIATNICARGIDIQQISLVLNYDLPFDKESYIHRISRCGRHGRRGMAINLVTSRDARHLNDIERQFECEITELPANFQDFL
eukprot:m.332152 g.332152  ORF g.332152 m.332152 type:complete len:422 (-) comp16056_c0_seq24:4043-5308(-)